MRLKWEIYADIIELCPMIYTRILGAANVNVKMFDACYKLDLVKKVKTVDSDSSRKEVIMIQKTDKGKVFEAHVRAIQELLRRSVI